VSLRISDENQSDHNQSISFLVAVTWEICIAKTVTAIKATAIARFREGSGVGRRKTSISSMRDLDRAMF
jgi:hypothetical protein